MTAQITALPTPPSTNDPANFNTRADAFLGQMPTFLTEANALSTEVNGLAVQVAQDKTAAAASAAAAFGASPRKSRALVSSFERSAFAASQAAFAFASLSSAAFSSARAAAKRFLCSSRAAAGCGASARRTNPSQRQRSPSTETSRAPGGNCFASRAPSFASTTPINDNRAAKLVKLVATCGPLDIDDPQPAITVMMPDED